MPTEKMVGPSHPGVPEINPRSPSAYDVQSHANQMLDLDGNPKVGTDGKPLVNRGVFSNTTAAEDYYNDVLAALPESVVNAPLKRAELMDYLDDIKSVMQSNASQNVRDVVAQQARNHLISYYGADRHKLPESLTKYGDAGAFPKPPALRDAAFHDPLKGASRAEILQTPKGE